MPLPIPLLAPVTTTDFPAIDVSMRPLPQTFWLQQCSSTVDVAPLDHGGARHSVLL
jgi:hypothetical protein